MKKINQFESFQETISHIKRSNISNIKFINYVKSQIIRAYTLKTITYDEQNILIRYLNNVCFLNGIKV